MPNVVSKEERISSKRFDQSGQILLVFVLIVVVGLTVGLSLAVRTITSERTSTEDENSQRAFSAAEAGIDRAFKETGRGESVIADKNLGNNAIIKNVSIQEADGSEILVNNGAVVNKDDGADIWLTDYPNFASSWPAAGSGSITVFWGADGERDCKTDEATNTMSAVEVIVVTGTKDNPTSIHYAADPCTVPNPKRGGSGGANNFSDVVGAGDNVKGKDFAFSTTIPNITNGLLVRIVPLYAKTTIGARTNANTPFPSQGQVIESLGTSGGTQRKLIVFNGNPKFPIEIFPYMLFSPQ